MMKKLLLISLYVALVFTAAGNEVYCNSSSDPKSCGPAGSGTWVQGSESYKFKISDCSAIGDSPQGIFDTFCASCPFGKSSNVPKIRMLNEGFQYAIRLQTECTNIAPEPGVPVDCQSKSSCSNCGNPPSLAFIWDISGESTTQCQIRSCLAAPIPTSGINDNFCISCGKTNKFANSDGSACVNPTGGNCSRQSAWNDEDCKICNENSANSAKVKASADKTSCISASNSNLYANQNQNGCQSRHSLDGDAVNCQKDGSCDNCGNLPSSVFAWAKQFENSENCTIISCLAAPMPTSGLIDNFCGSCGKDRKFSNSYGSACVSPKGGSCLRKTAWTDEDCNICYQNGANSDRSKASEDRILCVTPPKINNGNSSSVLVFKAFVIAILQI